MLDSCVLCNPFLSWGRPQEAGVVRDEGPSCQGAGTWHCSERTVLCNHSNCPGANGTGLLYGLSKRHTRPAARMRGIAAPVTQLAPPSRCVMSRWRCASPFSIKRAISSKAFQVGAAASVPVYDSVPVQSHLLWERISCIQQKAAPCWPPFWHMALPLFLCCHNAEFYTSQKANMCVACGETGHYLRYRVVPACYRKALPERLKSHRR